MPEPNDFSLFEDVRNAYRRLSDTVSSEITASLIQTAIGTGAKRSAIQRILDTIKQEEREAAMGRRRKQEPEQDTALAPSSAPEVPTPESPPPVPAPASSAALDLESLIRRTVGGGVTLEEARTQAKEPPPAVLAPTAVDATAPAAPKRRGRPKKAAATTPAAPAQKSKPSPQPAPSAAAEAFLESVVAQPAPAVTDEPRPDAEASSVPAAGQQPVIASTAEPEAARVADTKPRPAQQAGPGSFPAKDTAVAPPLPAPAPVATPEHAPAPFPPGLPVDLVVELAVLRQRVADLERENANLWDLLKGRR